MFVLENVPRETIRLKNALGYNEMRHIDIVSRETICFYKRKCNKHNKCLYVSYLP